MTEETEEISQETGQDVTAPEDSVEVDELPSDTDDPSDTDEVSFSDEGSAGDEVMEPEEDVIASSAELKPAIEALLFVAEEPLSLKQLCKILGRVDEDEVRDTLAELQFEYDARGSGLEIREIANGWRISTKPQYHDFIRAYLKTRPSARLSLPALETLAVIAYKQPITIPEIL
ncbi:MAG: SMC-Scp complex subunit ScpB, partial [Acidobacteriota bacterium]